MSTTLKERVQACERRNPHITHADIARAAGITQPSVAGWFNGTTNRLKLRTAVKAAQVWGCNPLWLGEGEGLPEWQDTIAPTARALVAREPPSILEALSTIAARLSAASDEQREAIATNLAGWARAGGRGPWASIVADLLSAPSRKLPATGT